MSDAIIELNDTGIRCFHAGVEPRTTAGSPGYAQLLPQQVITGEAARQKAYLAPQQSFNQFWDQLSLSPLSQQNALARHNADLAFAHLEQVYQDAGQPATVILAVPGSYSLEQLGILLGLTKAAGITVTGMVDAALLASHHLETGEYWHLDIQLHQLVATPIDIGSTIFSREAEVFPVMGLKALHNRWAHKIAEGFIHHYRYDPLHTAAGEQQIHDRLPEWLAELNQSAEIEISMATGQGDYQLRLIRAEFFEEVESLYRHVAVALKHQSKRKVLLSHRLATLPGFSSLFDNPEWLGEQDVCQGFTTYQEHLTAANGEIVRRVELPLIQVDSVAPNGRDGLRGAIQLDQRVSHVLYRGKAYPIADSLIFDEAKGLQQSLSSCSSLPGKELFAQQDDHWLLQLPVAETEPLQPGFQFDCHGEVLMLIEVGETFLDADGG